MYWYRKDKPCVHVCSLELCIFNRFFFFASGGGQPKYVIEANTRHVGPTCYCKVEIISIGHYLMGKYIFFNKLS